MKRDILSRIGRGVFLLDGATGTMLQAAGLPAGTAPELWNLSHPEAVTGIHRAYLSAGADAITVNSFGINGLRYEKKQLEALLSAALDCAERARDEAGRGEILLDVGPSGRLLRPYGDLGFEEAVALFSEVIRRAGTRADAILIETMTDGYETKAALLAAKESSSLPVFVTNVYGSDGKLATGADIPAMVCLLEGLGADAVGLNCSLGAREAERLVPAFYENASVPVIIRPNAGLPQDGKAEYAEDAAFFSERLAACVRAGARVVGGCCGTTPAHIAAARRAVGGISPLPVRERSFTRVCSSTHALTFGDRCVRIGERLNPTGKPRLREALRSGDGETVLREALAQAEAGAEALDLNAGVPGLDEAALLAEMTQSVQAVCDLPLQLDSASPAALSRAMRVYNGIPLVNSVNGTQASMDAVFPLLKKYGGVAVALTLDEKGIPEQAEGRAEIARRILARAAEYGIPPRRLLFDPLTTALSADESAARVTLDALSLLASLGLRTILGVSNVSFGLPERESLTAAFLLLALSRGLDAAILNPLSRPVVCAYHAFYALSGMDKTCKTYLSALAENSSEGGMSEVKADSATMEDLKNVVCSGMSAAAERIADALLATHAPLSLVDGAIVPALNDAGQRFEAKTLYLPQLLLCAEAAKSAFSRIRARLAASGGRTAQKGPVILATVRGDVHDIGKNIVKALLENYDFRVVDLGKDVPAERVAEAAARENAPVVGLSALMTTTLPAMEETIRLLKTRLPQVKIVAGGAVLTAAYARSIGADLYAADAMATVRFCESVVRAKQEEK